MNLSMCGKDILRIGHTWFNEELWYGRNKKPR